MKSIIITGAAGLVGQNLILRLKARGGCRITAIDKHPVNTATLRRLNPDITVIEADLATLGDWENVFAGAGILVLNHAQIGATTEAPFIANNVVATRNVLAAAKAHGVPYVVHISSSVVNSAADDFYTATKKAQERLVAESRVPSCILRPTLMFGWFDRKHLGWLAHFMERTPVFPVPGDGKFLRQPLYAGDFCNVIISAIHKPRPGGIYNITGQEKIDYIDLIRGVKRASLAPARIVKVPYPLFWLLLKIYGWVDRNPPFTTSQLKALMMPDVFDVIDWPTIFGVKPTPLPQALQNTFQHPVYSGIELEF